MARCWSACFFLALLVLAAAGPAAAQPDVISGRLEVVGCSPDPSAIHLKARPAIRPPSAGLESPEEMGVGVAKVLPKAFNAYPFTIPSLDPRKPYRLTVKFTGSQCGTLVWQGPDLVMPGQADLRLKGLAVRTPIEIADTGTGGSQVWVGARIVPLTDPENATVKLRVFSDLPGLTGYAIQVSPRPFATDRSFQGECLGDMPELLATKSVSVGAAGWSEVAIDLHEAIFPASIGALGGAAAAAAPAVIGSAAAGDTDGEVEDPALDLQTVTQQIARRQIELGAPVYLRAIPVLAGGERACDPETAGMSGWTIVSNAGSPFAGTSPVGDGHVTLDRVVYNPPKVFEYPMNGESCYRITEDHYLDQGEWGQPPTPIDWAWNTYIAAGGGYDPDEFLWKGKLVCVPPAGDADKAVKTGITLMTGTVEAAGLLVTTASRIWEEVKTKVATVIVAVVELTGVECDAVCQAAIEGGIDMALAAAGMPPSIPNWDELKAQGLNYVAGMIADQTGVPAAAIEKAGEYAMNAMEELNKTRGGTGKDFPKWLQADFGFEPAFALFTVSQAEPPGPGVPLHLAPRSTLTVAGSLPLLGGAAPLPAVFPPDALGTGGPRTLDVPLVLRPNFAALGPTSWILKDNPLANKIWWVKTWQYGPCVPLTTTLKETSPVTGEKVDTYPLTTLLWYLTTFHDPTVAFDGCK